MNKKIIIFDLDETLAESKCSVSFEIAGLLARLLVKHKVSVISGGNKQVVFKNTIENFPEIFTPEILKNLVLQPACGSQMWTFVQGKVKLEYILKLTISEKKMIFKDLKKMEEKFNLQILPAFGEKVEDRISQVAYSYLGQNAPLDFKRIFDPKGMKRKVHVNYLNKTLGKKFQVTIGGSSTLDITQKGIDKAYGAKKLMEHFKYLKSEMFFVGDKVFPGGNDYPIKKMGVDTFPTSGPLETEKIILNILN